ncbi:hypothetical protein JOE11_004615 [Robbsia andropogonis]|uniref:hypothetical protein n=1 Tax=Robbsia andropogonis TaxID=28092 RepID=UPI003D261916
MMKFGKSCIFSIALLLAPASVLAAVEPIPDIDRYADTVTSLFVHGDSDKAYKLIAPYYEEHAATKDIELYKTTLKNTIDMINQEKARSYECVQRKSYGESLVFIQCIMKTERVFYPIAFTFYKPQKNWILKDLLFSNWNTLYSAPGQ